jgi:HTH-type transcriptional regulator/antitoxin HipB
MMEQTIRTPMQLAKVLHGNRKKLKFTQKQAGEKVGLLAKTISAMENSPENSSIATLFKLLAALELELVLRPKGSVTFSDGEW